jgi:hypothetical protein
MPVRETELRDELVALIAAGRELSPDHDRALVEVFVDRMASRAAPPSRRRQVLAAVGRPQRILGALVLALAGLLGMTSVLGSHPADRAVQVQPVPKMHIVPGPGKVPGAPPVGKVPPVPQAPVPPKVVEPKAAP